MTTSGTPKASNQPSVPDLLIAAAATAPSILNTQPWSFDVHADRIDLYVDADRAALPRVDPNGRQLVVSCGAALFNMRVAAAHLARPLSVHLLPNEEDPTLLATVKIGPSLPTPGADADLQPAIRRRHTHRRAFTRRAVPGAIVGELAEAAHTEHAKLVVISRLDRGWLFDLVALSDAILINDTEYDDELAQWAGGDPSRTDGIPLSSFGTMSAAGSPPMRDFAHASPDIRVPHQNYPADPCVAILTTANDTPLAWLHAGQALQRVLLVATLRGLSASFLNQPLETEDIRAELFQLGHAQMIMRLGYAKTDVGTPRRPLAEVIRHHGGCETVRPLDAGWRNGGAECAGDADDSSPP